MLPKILKQAFIRVIAGRSYTKLALVVRSDLKMSKGKTAAQCAHAAVICYRQAQHGSASNQKDLDIWLKAGQPKIVLRVNNYEELVKLAEQAKSIGQVTAIVQDAGRTQLDPGTATVLGVGPGSAEEIDKLVAQLKLL